MSLAHFQKADKSTSTGENTKNNNRNNTGNTQEYLNDDVLKIYGGKKESKFITS